MSNRHYKHQKNRYSTKKRFAQEHAVSPQIIVGERTKPQKDERNKSKFELVNSLNKALEKNMFLEKDYSTLRDLICKLCVGIWRVQQKMIPDGSSEPMAEMKKAYRPIETMKDLLSQNGFDIQDLTGQPYIDGIDLNVIDWPQTDGIDKKMIIETIKPKVKFKDQFLERGEVIVGVPKESEKRLPKDEVSKDIKEKRLFKKLFKMKDI